MGDLIRKIVGDKADKQRWLAYKARVDALPAAYRSPLEALERYLAQRGW
ncbi:MAG: hypothetical protein HZY73_12785 [Micropruina sp.]|nr:MAG: hypothetical protein HZY73_12785 [Micropruina sp.]